MDHTVQTNAMSVDVEDYFQVSAFENIVARSDWASVTCRVESNTNQILDLFDDTETVATFFILGWVAERYPQLVREIVLRGHEVGSHGFAHIRATQQSPPEFRSDVEVTKKILEDITGEPVIGYRAASFSIAKSNLWVHQELADAGYEYSSSVYPVRHDLYGIPDAPRDPFLVKDIGILEIPLTTAQVLGRNLPAGGGGYFRLLPYGYSRWAIHRRNNLDSQPAVFYFHPWEIDAEQPRFQAPLKTTIRHYSNLSSMSAKLRRLTSEFRWRSMREIFLGRDWKTLSLAA